jgi:NTE family protein
MIKTTACLLLLLTGFCSNAQYPWKNLVLEGGGIRGMAYSGAIKVLDDKGVLPQIEKVAGTSAGSIVALLISLGYTAAEIDSTMRNLRIEQFNDGGGGLLGKYKRAKRYYGIYKGDTFEAWLEERIAEKTGNPLTNFAQLDSLIKISGRFRQFYCVGTNLTRQQLAIFSAATTPTMPLKTAVRISCSIPLFYEPVLLDSTGAEVRQQIKGYHYEVYVDGGMLANYPINIFDSCKNGGNPLVCDSVVHNYHTLGLKLERDEQIKELTYSTNIPPYSISSLNDYFSAVLNLMMETMNRKPNLENEKNRTIYIGYGNVASKPRKMNAKEKQMLYEKGVLAAKTFFSNATPGGDTPLTR